MGGEREREIEREYAMEARETSWERRTVTCSRYSSINSGSRHIQITLTRRERRRHRVALTAGVIPIPDATVIMLS